MHPAGGRPRVPAPVSSGNPLRKVDTTQHPPEPTGHRPSPRAGSVPDVATHVSRALPSELPASRSNPACAAPPSFLLHPPRPRWSHTRHIPHLPAIPALTVSTTAVNSVSAQ